MNKYLKILIPSIFLVMGLSAYAQKNSFEKAFSDFSYQVQKNFDSFNNQAQKEFDDFASQIGSVKQQQEETKGVGEKNRQFADEMQKNIKTYTANKPVPSPVRNSPCPENDLVCVCGNDKYCKAHIELLKDSGYTWDKIVNYLKDKKNHKQALYKSKYILTSSGITTSTEVMLFEQADIRKFSSFQDAQNYILDMPLMAESLSLAQIKLSQYYQGSEEEKEFINSLIDVLENMAICPANLDINNYGFDNFCTLSQFSNNKYKYKIISELKKLK